MSLDVFPLVRKWNNIVMVKACFYAHKYIFSRENEILSVLLFLQSCLQSLSLGKWTALGWFRVDSFAEQMFKMF